MGDHVGFRLRVTANPPFSHSVGPFMGEHLSKIFNAFVSLICSHSAPDEWRMALCDGGMLSIRREKEEEV